MSIDDFRGNLGVEHHRGPSAEQLVGVLGEEGDLGVQPGAAVIVVQYLTNTGGQPSGVANHLGALIDEVLLTRPGRQQAGHIQHAHPDHAGVLHQLEHDVLGESAPSLPSSAFQYFVDHCH